MANATVSRSTAAGAIARSLEEGGDARPGRASKPLETQPRDRAVLADDRGDVGDGADRREVGQVERGREPAGFVRQQELRDLERDATAGQPAVRVGRVRPVRVDDARAPPAGRPARDGGRSR